MNIDLVKEFANIDTSDYPYFYHFKKPLEMGLWVLLVVKEKLQIRKLTAEQIATIIVDTKEISIDAKTITKSFNRAKDKIHTYREDGKIFFEIMKPGKDHLISLVKEDLISVFYIEPDKRFTSKKLLSKNILNNLKGDLKIVDPYCGERTLDILHNIRNTYVKFLTRIENLKEKERERFLRELKDFKTEKTNIEFKNYPNSDIHDRYIISSDILVILGHSIKDLGSKETFAIILKRDLNKNIVSALNENFDRRWKISNTL